MLVCEQGDPMSASVFSIYINSLIDYVNELNLGVDIDGKLICILLYADDIVLIGKSEAELQSLLLSLETWCKQWQLHVNLEKSKIIHFRNPRKNRTEFLFKLNENDMEKVAVYKCLGLHIDEFLNLNTNSEHIANSASRALGGVISKFRSLKNVSFHTYKTLYNSSVLSVLNYSSEIYVGIL